MKSSSDVLGETHSEALLPDEIRGKIAASSFHAGMRILPKAEREAMFAIYGFCRIVDDIADDEGEDRATRALALNAWRADLAALYAGQAAGRAAFLADTMGRFGVYHEDFLAVIDGMAMDVEADLRWPNFATLDLYCDRVASAVGRLSVQIFGMERDEGIALSHHLGRALQFTNILRDIDEDAALGRVYLPAEALIEAGLLPSISPLSPPGARTPALTPEMLVQDDRLDLAARWLAIKAQTHFAETRAILARRPKGLLLAPVLMQAAYAPLLNTMIQRGWHAPRQRVSVSKPRLALLALRLRLFGA